MRTFLHSLKRTWMMFAHALGRVNTVIILTLFYFVILAPIGICVRIASLFKASTSPSWEEKKPVPPTLETLKRPF